MSINAMKLCSLILQEHFGENVRIVGEDLFKAKAKTIGGIMQSTQLSRKQITAALAILVQYRLVKFNALETNENSAEYVLHYDKILLFLRYPRYVYFITKKFGNPAALIVEELLKQGMAISQSVIIGAYTNSDTKTDGMLKELRDSFVDLVTDKYIVKCPEVTEDPVPQLKVNMDEIFRPPTIEMKELKALVEKGTDPSDEVSEKTFWAINSDRFHQSFRDKIMIDAIERQIDSSAGECFQYILQLMYNNTDPWALTSNAITSGSIKQLIEKKTTNKELIQYFDQYISIIEKDPCGFLEASTGSYGAYHINFADAFKELTWSIVENVIMQKFGNKAARIFRVVKTKKFIEQDDIQREAMMSAKEARLFTYNLLENNFLQIQTIKKSGGNTGPAKPFFLFHVNQQQIARDLIETCYKALYNSKVRVIQDKEANKRLMEKSIRLQFFIESLRERGEPEENIQEIDETLTPPEKEIVEKTKMRLKRLESSEMMIDEMLLILQLFIHYQTPSHVHNSSSIFYTGKVLFDYTDKIDYEFQHTSDQQNLTPKSILKKKN